MVLVQETKLEAMEAIVIHRMWGSGNVEFAFSSTVGALGGLLTLWNKSSFKASSVTIHRHFIILQGNFGDSPCTLVNVYAPNEVVPRRDFWEELITYKNVLMDPWCLGGDLNEIRLINERVGCHQLDRGIRDLLEFCKSMELLDIPMSGRRYTLTNYQDHAIHSRLDRFLLSHEFLDKFKVMQWGLPRPVSDHYPIMIIVDNRDWGPKPFRFMDMWLSYSKCMKVAKQAWEETVVSGWAGFSIVQKLKAVKAKLKTWNKVEFGDVNIAL